MQITINLPQDLEQDLIHQAAKSNVPLQVLIVQVLRQIVQSKSAPVLQWPDAVLSYKGLLDFPPFESYRHELLPPQESDLF